MEVAVYRNLKGVLVLRELDVQQDYDEKFVGYVSIPIEKPKKTVVKEAKEITDFGVPQSTRYVARFPIPVNAKNVKCTYEVEE